MIKKEEKSEITVPTANSNINSGSNANPISVSVPFPALGQQSSSNQTIPGSQISGQQASVISMSWASSVQHNSNPGLPVNQSLRNNMPVNTIHSSHTVLSAPSVHLATVPATIATRQPTTQIRPNIGIIQDTRSHHTTTPHNSANNHSLHHISSNIHHVTGNIQNTSTQPQVNQQTTSNQHSTPQSQQPQYQRLKVEDALSYLDQVKFQFNSQPQVYNDFLDIMKEFKSQSIDTPGVIQRVSNLFRGHPELIVGFNTFLPPGYKIEMQANDQVNVSMPNRTTSAIIINGPPTTISATTPVVSTQTTLSNNVQQSTVSLNSTSSNNSNRPINFGANALHAAISNVSSNNQLRASSNSSLDLNSTANLNSSNNSVTSTNGTTSTLSQPVEFNHAITYVNKIKNRFQAQPEVYKQFLEILHAYQKEQKIIKEGKTPDSKPLTESEVYLKVAKLFQNQDDLLQEFGQFLPESNSSTINNSTMFGQNTIGGQHYSSFINCSSSSNSVIDRSLGNLANSSISTVHSAAQHVDGLSRSTNDHGTIVKRPIIRGSTNSSLNNVNVTNVSSLHSKRQVPTNNFNQNMHSPNKKPKMTSLRDVSFAEASKYASLNEYSFFDKVRKALKSQEVYDNFLRFLVLYNHEILSRSELLSMMTNFLGKHPELLKWFKDFIGHKSLDNNSSLSGNHFNNSQYSNSSVNSNFFDGLTNRVVGIRERERERINSEVGMEIDYNSCKRYGASYRALPKNYVQPKCSGRTQLCKDVLNDTWVSFPSWSEDSTFVTSRKTQYEEYIYRCEDERYELDVVIETNLTAIRVFEALQKKLNRMTPEERSKFKLDDTLGGSSVVIIQRAIKRIYGDKAPEIVEGLKKSPAVAVPLVYKRLRAKEEEWREAQKHFNKIWREQNEKYYLKSLDHQGISFKQNDIKYLRSKSLINEIESIFDEKHEQNEDNSDTSTGPHMVFVYKNKSMLEETCNLIIHHVKRQTSIHKSDKQKIKQLLKHFIPDLFGTPRGDLSDDELEDTDLEETNIKEKDTKTIKNNFSFKDLKSTCNINNPVQINNQKPTSLTNNSPSDVYSLFIVNQSWYLFFRLHHILCNRLGKMKHRANVIAEEELKEKSFRKDSPAIALRLKNKTEYEVENYFAGLIDMVKQLLDGNLDSNQYEDQLREMFGIHAYISFTLDKVVQNIVRQLQHIVCDEGSVQSTELFLEASKFNATGGSCSTAFLRVAQEYSYQKKAESVLSEENIFKTIIYKEEGKLTIELLDSESTDSEDESTPTVKWADYINKYAKENSNITEALKQRLMRKPLFLLRKITALKENSSRELSLLDKDDIIDKATKSVEINDGTECKFDVNSFKAVFLTDTGSYLYRTKSLIKARSTQKKIFNRLRDKFKIFHQEWVDKNCTIDQITDCENWLNGEIYENELKKEKIDSS